MTTSEQKALKRDLSNPLHLFTIIVENNPEGVSNQMQSWGLTYSSSTPDEMIKELVKAYNAGGAIKAGALQLVRNVKYKYGVLPAGFDQAITGQAPPPKMLTTDGQGSDQSWYSEMDWGGIIDSIFGGVDKLTDKPSTPPSTTAPPITEPSGAGAGINPQWFAVGGAVLVVILALFIAMRK